MKLYKYRDFTNPQDLDFQRLTRSVQRCSFWCARPDTLNDPNEFIWTCDYGPTHRTVDLLTELLTRFDGRSRALAGMQARCAISGERLEAIARPAVTSMIQQCRADVGLACFGDSCDNGVLWHRYAGSGAGVCIEVEVNAELVGSELFAVCYCTNRRIRFDELAEAFLDRAHLIDLYRLAFLSKSPSWADEKEIRFVSRQHSVNVLINGRVTKLILGQSLSDETRLRIRRAIGEAPIPVMNRQNVA